MIQIERIRMRLPSGFRHRATSIAGLVGDALTKQPVSQDMSLESVSLTPQKISVNNTDTEIAGLIVKQIVSSLEGNH